MKKKKFPWEKKWEMTRSSIFASPLLPIRDVPDRQCLACHASDPQVSESSGDPLDVWSLSREPAPREFPARQRHHLPVMTLLQMSPSLSPDQPAGEREHCLAV